MALISAFLERPDLNLNQAHACWATVCRRISRVDLIWVKAARSDRGTLEPSDCIARQREIQVYGCHAVDDVGAGAVWGCCMLRLMAMLIVCAVALLLQGAPVWAHDNEVGWPVDASCSGSITKAETVPLGEDDCLGGDGCCMIACSTCQSQLGAHLTIVERIRLESSLARLPNGDIIRSVVLAQDPPIPRIHHFQAL